MATAPANHLKARAIGDLLLARADGSPRHFYSLSAQIQRERKVYYDILDRTQKGTLEVTEWLAWFLAALHRAVDRAQRTLDAVLTKARFWQRLAGKPLNARQVKLLNCLLDGFVGRASCASLWREGALPAMSSTSFRRGREPRNDLVPGGAATSAKP